MNASRSLILFFGLSSVVLAGIVAVELQPSPAHIRTVRADAAAPTDKTRPETEQRMRLDSVRSYDVISDRPLFSETRRPPDRPPADESGSASESLRHVGLTGVIITPARKTALIYSQNSPDVINLQEGQSIEGWRLDRVMHDRIVLSRGDEKTEINIWDMTRPRPPRHRPPAVNQAATDKGAKSARSKTGPDGEEPAKGKPISRKAPPGAPAEGDAANGKASEERVVRKAPGPDR